jgi:hypothetical protein
MFSNRKKFFKKNILLIGIVLFVILIVIYCVCMYNFQEGFDSNAPVNLRLIPVSTLKQMYVEFGNTPEGKLLQDSIIEFMTLIIANYDEANKIAILIDKRDGELRKLNTTLRDAQGRITSATPEMNDAVRNNANIAIEPLVIKLLPATYKILLLRDSIYKTAQPIRSGPPSLIILDNWIRVFINVTIADKTLASILGPNYSTPLPNTGAEQTPQLAVAVRTVLTSHYDKLIRPFQMINGFASWPVDLCQVMVANTLTNDATDQASITNLQERAPTVSTPIKTTPPIATTPPIKTNPIITTTPPIKTTPPAAPTPSTKSSYWTKGWWQ